MNISNAKLVNLTASDLDKINGALKKTNPSYQFNISKENIAEGVTQYNVTLFEGEYLHLQYRFCHGRMTPEFFQMEEGSPALDLLKDLV